MATIQGFSKVFIVIDALDECPYDKGQRRTLLESLSRIEATVPENIHLLCTSRSEPDIKATFDSLLSEPSKADFDLSNNKDIINEDIGLFIYEELSSSTYASWPTDFRAYARDVLLEKANGMYAFSYIRIYIKTCFSRFKNFIFLIQLFKYIHY